MLEEVGGDVQLVHETGDDEVQLVEEWAARARGRQQRRVLGVQVVRGRGRGEQ